MSIVYPGRPVVIGDPRADVVRQVQTALLDRGYMLDADGLYGRATATGVKMFQGRFGLDVDGVVGPLTWAALFAAAPAPHDPLLGRIVTIAESQIGVRETSPNRGPEIDGYLMAVGLNPARGRYSWCAAYVYWCIARAAVELDVPCPCPRTASALAMWRRSPKSAHITTAQAIEDPRRIRPGLVFVADHGAGKGHVGFVDGFADGTLSTIEGNTDGSGTREGDGVYRRRRRLDSINIGLLDFTRRAT